jgi:quercetin dioxygenase-like cupin family protein
MKTGSFVIGAVAAFGLTALAAAEGASSLDPAVVNAKTVHVTLENDRVRVLEAVLKPGDKERLHAHPACVIHVLAGGTMRNHTADGQTTDTTFVTGQTIYRDPLTHWAENIGTTTVHILIVELKDHR